MILLCILAICVFVFCFSWVLQHGLPVLGWHVESSDHLLLCDLVGDEIIEA